MEEILTKSVLTEFQQSLPLNRISEAGFVIGKW